MRTGIKSAEFVQKFDLSAIYSSPRSRASETASIIAESCETFYSVHESFCEIDFGDFEGLSYTEIEQKFPAEFKIWMENANRSNFPERRKLFANANAGFAWVCRFMCQTFGRTNCDCIARRSKSNYSVTSVKCGK
ncbi:MAG: histidine phosphatase family protein [Blastocatellia bacterium]|nr:histidine phosphatase family protein [Blastocatellia bacterium]